MVALATLTSRFCLQVGLLVTVRPTFEHQVSSTENRQLGTAFLRE